MRVCHLTVLLSLPCGLPTTLGQRTVPRHSLQIQYNAVTSGHATRTRRRRLTHKKLCYITPVFDSSAHCLLAPSTSAFLRLKSSSFSLSRPRLRTQPPVDRHDCTHQYSIHTQSSQPRPQHSLSAGGCGSRVARIKPVCTPSQPKEPPSETLPQHSGCSPQARPALAARCRLLQALHRHPAR
jgi:hypothetical protein